MVEADAVVLDVDGVLVDVADSYRRAIVETVVREHDADAGLVRAAIQPLKNAGGFNNDWLVTDALARYALARDRGYDAAPAAFGEAVAARGAGLDGVRAVLVDALGPETADVVDAAWDPDRLRRVFQTCYLGSDRYPAFEGGEPAFDAPGYIEDEPVLVEPATLDALVDRPLAVLTGRPADEAAVALARVGFGDLPEDRRVTMDTDLPDKPAPDGLHHLADVLGARSVAFVGDTLDDVRAARAADESDPDRRYRGIGVLTGGLTGETGRAAFREAGAAVVLDDVNGLPARLDRP